MNRPVNINFALNGFVVQCGCQTIVFNRREDLLKHLDSYLQDPDKTEKEFVAAAVNRKITLGGQVEMPPPPTGLCGAEGIRGYYNTADAPRTPYPEPSTCCSNAVG